MSTKDIAAEAAQKDVVVAPPLVVGGLIVMGSHLISPRMLEMVDLISRSVTPNGIATVIFRDDNHPQHEGKPVHAKFFTDSLSIVINIDRHMNEVYSAVEDMTASIVALYWETMLNSLGHEFFHAKSWMAAEEELKDTILGDEAHEADAIAFSKKLLEDLAKAGNDMEPPIIATDPRLSEEMEMIHKLMEEHSEEVKEGDWMSRQVKYLEEGVLFEDEEGKKYMTFKSFLRALSGDTDNPAWDEPTMAVKIDSPIEKVETVAVEVVATGVDAAAEANVVEQVVKDTVATHVEPIYDGDEGDLEYPMEGSISLDAMMDQMMEQTERANPTVVNAPIDTTTTVVDPVKPAIPAGTPPPPVETGAPAGGYKPIGAYQPEQFQNNGAGVVTQYTAPGTPVATLTPLNLTQIQQRAIIEQVFARLFNHLFSKCDFNPQTYQSSFGHPEGVMEYAVPINDIPGASELFLSHDFGDQAIGMTVDAPNDTGIRGTILKNTRLPAYSLWVNKAGVKTQLKMIPQNPDKTFPAGDARAGQLKPSAVRVRHNGSAITWVMEETPRGQMSNYLLAYEMDVGKPLSWRWMENK